MIRILIAGLLLSSIAVAETPRLLWGDLHVHSNNSFDAFLNGNRNATPETAYRYARGEPVIHPSTRARVQIDRPLDFIAVADHAEFYGVARKAVAGKLVSPNDASPLDRLKLWGTRQFIRLLVHQSESSALMERLLPKGSDAREFALSQPAGAPVDTSAVERDVWLEALETADRYNEPGRFTALVGWEWSSTPGGANLHRVVVSNADAEAGSTIRPFSAVDSPFPEDLWRWLDTTGKRTGIEFLAIPHNSNISKGFMFDERTLRGKDFTADDAALRQRLEPVAEITQIKGDSETHSLLSPGDEFAEFETYGWYMQQDYEPYAPKAGDYLRSALLRGLAIEQRIGDNPYRLGFIGSSDSHTALASVEEDNFHGKHANQATPETKGSPDTDKPQVTGWSMSAAGLAAVWARDNTRDAIVEALQRREVYATTGPRIALQFYGSRDFSDLDITQPDSMNVARKRGIPMGSVLPEGSSAPEFVATALRDPASAGLDRLQIIKGWVADDGSTREVVYDVAWSGDRKLDAQSQLAPIADTVDRRTGAYNPDIGAASLSARWRDPDFDPSQPAFYYVRVLEAPTARHLLLDAITLGLDQPREGAAIIQERAYSSPIWYRPTSTLHSHASVQPHYSRHARD